MTDLEMTRLCAEALDLLVEYDHSGVRLLVGNDVGGYNRYDYDPLHNDTQAMALVKSYSLKIYQRDDGSGDPHALWDVCGPDENWGAVSDNLNRAIVECCAKTQVAKMQKERT